MTSGFNRAKITHRHVVWYASCIIQAQSATLRKAGSSVVYHSQPQVEIMPTLHRLADWFVIVDEQGRVTDVSASIAGYRRDHLDVLGTHWSTLFPEPQWATVRNLLAGAQADPCGLSGPSPLVLPGSGEQLRCFEVTIGRLTAAGTPHYACLFRDITPTAASLEAIACANRNALIAQIASSVAHDFNNVLAGIMLNAGLIADTCDVHQEPLVQRVLASTERGAAVCRNLLSFVRNTPAEPRSVAVEPLLHDITGLFETQARRHGVSVSYSTRGDLALFANPSHVQQILLNLLFCARDAVGQNGWIDMTAGESKGTVSIEVRTSVPLILDHDAATVSGHLAEAMGGRLAFEPPQDGKTTITLALPAAKTFGDLSSQGGAANAYPDR